MKNVYKNLIASTAIFTSLSLTGCTPDKEIQFNDTLSYISTQKTFEAALGVSTIYVLSGEYRGLKAGQCMDLQKNIRTFSILKVLQEYPELKTDSSIKAANEQNKEFKVKHSLLYIDCSK